MIMNFFLFSQILCKTYKSMILSKAGGVTELKREPDKPIDTTLPDWYDYEIVNASSSLDAKKYKKKMNKKNFVIAIILFVLRGLIPRPSGRLKKVLNPECNSSGEGRYLALQGEELHSL